MEKKERVLGYYKSIELTNKELLEVSGGFIKLTCQSTHQITGYYPGTTDAITDQEWD